MGIAGAAAQAKLSHFFYLGARQVFADSNHQFSSAIERIEGFVAIQAVKVVHIGNSYGKQIGLSVLEQCLQARAFYWRNNLIYKRHGIFQQNAIQRAIWVAQKFSTIWVG